MCAMVALPARLGSLFGCARCGEQSSCSRDCAKAGVATILVALAAAALPNLGLGTTERSDFNMINTPPLLTGATYVALLFAIFGLWFGRRVWITALALAVMLGYTAHVLVGVAGVWILAFAGLCAGYDRAKTGASGRGRAVYMALSALGILVLGVLVAAHALPG